MTSYRTNWNYLLAIIVLLGAVAIAVIPAAAWAETVPSADEWLFSVTPYLWLPNINGTLRFNIPPGASGAPDVEAGPNSYLQNLQAVIMLSGDARKDRWSVFTDVIYLSFNGEESTVKDINFGGDIVSSSENIATTSTLRGTAWTLGAGYAVVIGKSLTLDAFGGFRYFDVKASASWLLLTDVTGPGGGHIFPRAGGISEEVTLWDGIVGVRGRIPLGRSDWFIPYYLDIGTGSSSLTAQGFLGIGCAFTWGNVTLAYRELYYDQNDNKLLQNFRFSGPALGATFRF